MVDFDKCGALLKGLMRIHMFRGSSGHSSEFEECESDYMRSPARWEIRLSPQALSQATPRCSSNVRDDRDQAKRSKSSAKVKLRETAVFCQGSIVEHNF